VVHINPVDGIISSEVEGNTISLSTRNPVSTELDAVKLLNTHKIVTTEQLLILAERNVGLNELVENGSDGIREMDTREGLNDRDGRGGGVNEWNGLKLRPKRLRLGMVENMFNMSTTRGDGGRGRVREGEIGKGINWGNKPFGTIKAAKLGLEGVVQVDSGGKNGRVIRA
jgi:hypothetical protein